MSLTPSTAHGSRCNFCIEGITIHDLHTWTSNTTTPAKGERVRDILPIDTFVSIDTDVIKEGAMCSYCEDVYSIDDMNNNIDRWLCNQCYNDHVLNE